ncbi:MAG: glycoside hydrolase family 18 protein [Bryobacteraceae bacterium]|nr:glycoside hydrolase family 18 protein [Bryobacteraceae bacterium]
MALSPLSLLGVAAATSLLSGAATPVPAAPAIVGYVFTRNAVLAPGSIDARSMTRINYAFANIAEGRIVAGAPADEENFKQLNALKRDNPALTVLVSVGGWTWSGNFSDAVLTAQSRKIFVNSAVDFLRRYELDGLDIDWEYPGMKGAGNRFRQEDGHNFTLALKQLRKAFDHETKKTHRRLYLTIAAGASDAYLAHSEMGKDQKYLDTVNLMAYDYFEPGSDPLTGHNSPLFTNPADTRGLSSEVSVKAFERAGVPAAKILLGVPFYGHAWGEVADVDHGLFQPGKAAPHGAVPHGMSAEQMLALGYSRYWDAAAAVPYLYNPQTHVWFSYEDTESVAGKCRYVKDHKLGGIMFWEYSSDPSGALLKTINQTLRGVAGDEKAQDLPAQ